MFKVGNIIKHIRSNGIYLVLSISPIDYENYQYGKCIMLSLSAFYHNRVCYYNFPNNDELLTEYSKI
jgi:hypothetical protein